MVVLTSPEIDSQLQGIAQLAVLSLCIVLAPSLDVDLPIRMNRAFISGKAPSSMCKLSCSHLIECILSLRQMDGHRSMNSPLWMDKSVDLRHRAKKWCPAPNHMGNGVSLQCK